MRSYMVLFSFFFVCCSPPALGFQPTLLLPKVSTTTTSRHRHMRLLQQHQDPYLTTSKLVVLRLSPQDENDVENTEDETAEESSTNQALQEQEQTQETSTPSQQTSNVISSIQTGVLYAFAAAVGVGLLLNLFGYGYIISPTDGLRIDTLSELRMESSQDAASSSSASAGGGGMLVDFFLKNPFVATLIFTGVVILYENIFYGGGSGNKKK